MEAALSVLGWGRGHVSRQSVPVGRPTPLRVPALADSRVNALGDWLPDPQSWPTWDSR